MIHDKVYDITDLLVEHPGGEEELVEKAAGVDGTESYEDTWPSDDNREMLKSFYIGDLDPADRTGRVVRRNRFSSRGGGQKEERKEDSRFNDCFYVYLQNTSRIGNHHAWLLRSLASGASFILKAT